jgi:phosphoribosylformylglycinamidine synthase
VPAVRVLILRAPGTNCEAETAFAWELVGAQTAIVHVEALIERPAFLSDFQILTIPGGFSYGDDIAAGRIFATDLKLYLQDQLRAFIGKDRFVLGICNGFQVLLRAGLLPGEPFDASSLTLTANTRGRYEDRWVRIAPRTQKCVFLDDAPLSLPVAHAEGRLVADDDSIIAELKSRGHVACCYVDDQGDALNFPANPSGSLGSIAGLTDATGRVFGLMPHPERHVRRTQQPGWTRQDHEPDGLRIFRNAVARLR